MGAEMEAKPHPRQDERLRVLRSYQILDTPRESDFDEIVALAAAVCGTAISVVNLIDSDRQWFKAETGLGVRETPLATSICAHMILGEDFIEIPDTAEDPRLADNPLVTGTPGLRFYAGALLRADDGLPIGTLCVLDPQPRRLTELQRQTLRVLARQVMAQLGMRRALHEAETLRREVDHRVRNSLALLAALTRLESREAPGDEARTALAAVERRISALSMLHEQLYAVNDGQSVDLGAFVERLGGALREVAPPGTTITVATEAVTVGSRDAAAVGILLNELATNAIKHAFPDGGGTVALGVRPVGEGCVAVDCADDGVGMSHPAAASAPGLGLKVLDAVCGQLGGRLDLLASDRGTARRIVFRPAEV
jgi:two-component sensor histidine kinase